MAGESANAEDSSLVSDRYDAKHAEWTERGMVNWDASEVPDFAFSAVTVLLALDAMMDFSAPSDVQNALAGMSTGAQSSLYAMQAKPISEAPLETSPL